MLVLFGKAPNDVRWSLMQAMVTRGTLLEADLAARETLSIRLK
jgi:hypothetical protein